MDVRQDMFFSFFWMLGIQFSNSLSIIPVNLHNLSENGQSARGYNFDNCLHIRDLRFLQIFEDSKIVHAELGPSGQYLSG